MSFEIGKIKRCILKRQDKFGDTRINLEESKFHQVNNGTVKSKTSEKNSDKKKEGRREGRKREEGGGKKAKRATK